MGHAPRSSSTRIAPPTTATDVAIGASASGSVDDLPRVRAELEREVGELLMDFGEVLRRRCRELAEESGLKMSDFQILHMLRERPHRMGEVADELGYDASHITALVDRLESLGLVERQGDPHDRRVKRIVLTPAGRRRVTAFERRVFGVPELFAGLTPSQLRQLSVLLRRAVGSQP